ncbi:LysE family translocator [Oceanibacterium hippocampi]|nr:LysE family transporter [Oceanibacterium hippocampi]
MPVLFLKAIGAGLALAAPVGPVGVLCVRRTIVSGRLSGLTSGFGAAIADAMFGAVAAFGLTLVSGFLLENQVAIRVIGGVLMLALAVRIWTTTVLESNGGRARESLLRGFLTTFMLTLTNPITILAFAGVFAVLGLASELDDPLLAAILVAGVFVGSALWWIGIALGASRLKDFLDHGGLRWVNRFSALLLVGFGIYALLSVV